MSDYPIVSPRWADALGYRGYHIHQGVLLFRVKASSVEVVLQVFLLRRGLGLPAAPFVVSRGESVRLIVLHG